MFETRFDTGIGTYQEEHQRHTELRQGPVAVLVPPWVLHQAHHQLQRPEVAQLAVSFPQQQCWPCMSDIAAVSPATYANSGSERCDRNPAFWRAG